MAANYRDEEEPHVGMDLSPPDHTEMTILNSDEQESGKCLDHYDIAYVFPSHSRLMKVIEKKDEEEYTLKRMNKHSPESSEICILSELKHYNIISYEGTVTRHNPSETYIKMEFCEETLAELLKSFTLPFDQRELKCFMGQLMSGVHYLHDHHIIHRDISPSNILISSLGEIKIADFGKAVKYHPDKEMPCNVGTPGYRAPELIVDHKQYTYAVDMWSVGCLFGELCLHRPLFPDVGTDIMQLREIVMLCGASDFQLLPCYLLNSAIFDAVKGECSTLQTVFCDVPEPAVDLLRKFFNYDFVQRITAGEVLHENYFFVEPTACVPMELMPYFRRKKRPVPIKSEPPVDEVGIHIKSEIFDDF